MVNWKVRLGGWVLWVRMCVYLVLILLLRRSNVERTA